VPGIAFDITTIEYISPNWWTLPLTSNGFWAKKLILRIPDIPVVLGALHKLIVISSLVKNASQRRYRIR
jgi:hypothetical protein